MDKPFLKDRLNCKVYLLKCEQFYKIGYAKDICERLINLQTACPFKITLFNYIDCSVIDAREIEKFCHNKFSEKRIHGEWFLLNNLDIVEFRNIKIRVDNNLNLNENINQAKWGGRLKTQEKING